MQPGLADRRATNLDFGVRLALEALDHDDVDPGQHCEQLGERGLRRAAKFAHQRQTPRRGDEHLPGAGRAVLVEVLAGPVDVEIVMGVLEGRHAEAAPLELGDEPHDQRRLSRAAPAGEADHAHGSFPAVLLRSLMLMYLSGQDG